MNFLQIPVDYSTYAFYSSSLCRKHFPKLVKNTFYLNLPLLLFGIIETATILWREDIALLREVSFLLKTGLILASLWIVPSNHLKLYQNIFSILELKPVSGEKIFASSKRIARIFKYLFGHSLYVIISFVFLFLGAILAILISSVLFLLSALIHIDLLGIIFINFLALAGIIVFAFSFGLPCFLPVLIAFPEKNKNFILRTAYLSFTNARQVILVYFLEGLMKIISYLVFLSLIFIISSSEMNFNIRYVFEIFSDLTATSPWRADLYSALAMIMFGIFNLFWDAFKAFFLSFLYFHQSRSFQPVGSSI